MSAPQRLRDLLNSGSDTLACGQAIDGIIEQAADGRADQLTPHQQTCPHCQAALREFSQLWQPVRNLAAQTVTVPAALKAAVTAQIDRLVTDVWYTLQLTEGGAIRIAARVVATIARDTAHKVPGVRVALGRSTESKIAILVEKATLAHRHPHAAVGVLGRTAVVDLALAVSYGERVDAIAAQVQQNVIAELRDKIGLQDVAVNITVDDVIVD
ncbi:MAG: Asp23/Gls24 family envelope stress response protein [Actinomycetota bacterium]|nr:Asp23/Gls24 family envelope stress response protein [Actinomycetota bacterium]